ncbi:MAG: DUF3078 domain-containing protein [Saprospiraceae bacterium]
MRHLFTLILLSLTFTYISAQTLEDLKKQKSDLEAKLAPVVAESDALKAEIDAVNGKIATYPGWYKGFFGLIGANFSSRNDWYAAANLKNSKTSLINGSLNGFLNHNANKYFWNNKASLNLGWQKQNIDGESDAKFQPVADQLSVSSLFGYKISSKLAASALGEYRSSILSYTDTLTNKKVSAFNNPGYLDLGVGVTYTPIKNMVLVFHPLNYNFIFSDNDSFTSSLGCKIMGDYNTTIYKGIAWRSNLSAFLSYKNSDPSLHNGTWTNWFGFKIFNGIGVGIEHALRYSPQEGKLLNIGDKLQSYYVIGLTYSL